MQWSGLVFLFLFGEVELAGLELAQGVGADPTARDERGRRFHGDKRASDLLLDGVEERIGFVIPTGGDVSSFELS
jgi:hypothetical protein